jgi:hypothetical protein
LNIFIGVLQIEVYIFILTQNTIIKTDKITLVDNYNTNTLIPLLFQYISNKMQRYTVYLYLETAVQVSGGTSTHHQERKQLYLQHLAFVTPLLLSAATVEVLELV